MIYHASYIKLIDDNPCAGIRYGPVSVDLIQDVEAGWTQGGCMGRHRLLGKDRTTCRLDTGQVNRLGLQMQTGGRSRGGGVDHYAEKTFSIDLTPLCCVRSGNS